MKKYFANAPVLAFAAGLLLFGCDSYEAPITSDGPSDDGLTTSERGPTLGKIVENERGGVVLANGFRITLLNVDIDPDGSRKPRPTFTWEVSKEGATSDMTQFAVEIPSVCTNPGTLPAPADANPVGSPSNGFNFNNGVDPALTGLRGEFHPNNSDKDSPRQFSLTFDVGYRVGYVQAAVQTTGGRSDVAWVLGPCANVFDGPVSVFEDLDGDGLLGSDEAGITGVTVGLLENGGTTSSVDATTDGGGAVEFVGLFTGDSYEVNASGPAVDDLVLTATPPITISDGSGGVIGFDKFDIIGNVFVDATDTGNANTEELDAAGLGGVLVELWTDDGSGNPGTFVVSTTSSSFSGALGDYSFPDQEPGEYVVKIPDAEATLNEQIFDYYDSTTSTSVAVAVGIGLNGSTDPYYCDPADFTTPPAAGSACSVDFGWAPNNSNIRAAFESGDNELTTAPYNYWKKTIAAACRRWNRGTAPVLNLSDGSSQDLNAIVDSIAVFAFRDPFFDGISDPDVCDAKDILDRPIRTELEAYRIELLTAEFNAFTPTFGLTVLGVDEYVANDPRFIYELLRFSEADYLERELNGFPNQKVGSYAGTATLNAYNGGGGGGGGTGFE